MTDTPNRLPLWEVMYEAFWQCPRENWRLSSAYMIRALRDWILAELETAEGEGWLQPNLIELPDLEALLTTEADRAEQNDNT